jgi:hypothetical protein
MNKARSLLFKSRDTLNAETPLRINDSGSRGFMKRIVTMAVLLMSITQLPAQESFVVYLHGANAVPPNASAHTGQGMFTLDGNTLNYAVAIGFSFIPTGGGIYGPARPGENGPLIFEWTDYVFVAPLPGDEHGGGQGGGISFVGGYTLTTEQVAQLLHQTAISTES